MNPNKRQLISRNIKAKTVSQSVADLIIEAITRHHFRLFLLAQVCLALLAAMPTTSNGAQALSDNDAAESDMTFPADERWSSTGNLHTARDIHTATLLPNGLVLVAGGLNTASVESRSAELYDPASGTWTATASLNEGRFYYTATLLNNGKVLVAGGYVGDQLVSTDLYDPLTNTWTPPGSMLVGRYLHAATLLGNGKV